MFTLIPKTNLDKFLAQYSELHSLENINELLLYELNSMYMLPRYFYENYPSILLNRYIDENFKPQQVNIEFTGELRKHQKDPLELLERMYNNQGYLNGIFQAYPSFGKTVTAAYLSSKFKQKTLIILDNTKLVEQWIDSYTKFTNLTVDDIGIFQGTKCQLDKPVIIAMVQTLLSKVKNSVEEFYIKIRDAGINLVFYDEVHATSSAPGFCRSTILLNTRNIIGLTATPYVQNVNKILLKNTIGDTLLSVKDYDSTPSIVLVKYDSGLTKKHGYRMSYSTDFIKKLAYFNSIIYDNPIYLENISKAVKKCIEEDRRILILTSTEKQVQTITANLINKGIDAKPFYSKQRVIDQEVDKILVATTKYASKGFDYAQLSALILACPLQGKISLIQSIGRILRKHDDKPKPVVYDLIETGFDGLFLKTIQQKVNIYKDEFKTDTIIEL